MPTGYTAELMEKGQDFETFVLRCARAFGALILMRDEAMNAEIPEFKPSPYYEESLAKHKAELARLQAMSKADSLAFGKSRKDEAIKRNKEWLEKETAENVRLDEMAIAVNQWQPPTKDHVALKEFMLEQIKISRNNCEYITEEIGKLKDKSPDSYYGEALASEARGIGYCIEELEKEVSRTNDRNEWVRQLRESLSKVHA